MNIEALRTLRAFESWPSYHLIYEWEDIISKIMKLYLVPESKQYVFLNRVVRKIGFNFLYLQGLHKSTHLYFDMTAKTKSDSGRPSFLGFSAFSVDSSASSASSTCSVSSSSTTSVDN